MIRSMTGFGDASSESEGTHYLVEVRSLNNRYFKCSLRVAEAVAGLEAELESALRKRVSRGSFTLAVKLRVAGERAVNRVNETALMSYLAHLETVESRLKDGQGAVTTRIDLTNLLALPGVLEPSEDESELLDRARPVVLGLLDQAVDRLDQMRVTEGRQIADDLLKQRDQMGVYIDEVAARAPVVVEEYHAKLRARVDELIAKAQLKTNESDLLREVAVYADRADISEEIARTRGHLDHFQSVIEGNRGEAVGRTLDFIAQELLREANTIASKSNDAAISHAAVGMKSTIDRIKEQVQNVE